MYTTTTTKFDMASGKSNCACKGIRTCLICEHTETDSTNQSQVPHTVYTYCPQCEKAWSDVTQHPDHHGNSLAFPGVLIVEEFVSEAEEKAIVAEIYKAPFVDSQSGRRKQDFGPKVNFKKKKIKSDTFTGLPPFSRLLYDRLVYIDLLKDFLPVEQCHLEYLPERGSSIDPHFDDFWVWGDRLVTFNLLSDTVLYFTHSDQPNVEVRVILKRGCLAVVYGAARTEWKHGIHRSDITSQRIAVTLRELAPEFLHEGNRQAEGQALLDIAMGFNGKAVGTES